VSGEAGVVAQVFESLEPGVDLAEDVEDLTLLLLDLMLLLGDLADDDRCALGRRHRGARACSTRPDSG
jgi:hypothetical protein